MGDDARDRGEAVITALRDLVRAAWRRRAGVAMPEVVLEEITIRLDLELGALGGEPGHLAARLIGSIEEQIEETLARRLAFRPGRAFCHHCRSSGCAHGEVPSSLHIFAGLTPTGLPVWKPLAQVCLELRHPDVQGLYDDPPAFVALVQDGETLQAGLLDAWRAPAFQLLGQVAAGIFRLPARASVEGRGGGMALTLQVVATRGPRGSLRPALNLIGTLPEGADPEWLWDRLDDLPWMGGVKWARLALQSVAAREARAGRPAAEARRGIEERVARILAGLARRLERDQRGRARRTGHAHRRHLSGERPTRKAFEDAREAPVGDLLVDERSGALIVQGGRGRTHFFTPEGRLVSSVRYSRDAIERKRRTGVWRAATGEEAREWQSTLERGGAPPGADPGSVGSGTLSRRMSSRGRT